MKERVAQISKTTQTEIHTSTYKKNKKTQSNNTFHRIRHIPVPWQKGEGIFFFVGIKVDHLGKEDENFLSSSAEKVCCSNSEIN